MAKSTRKKIKETMLRKEAKGAKKAQKISKSSKGCFTAGQTKAAEYTDCLLELHKLQGTLLTRLRREI
jgi:hypothetical protein